MSKKSFYVCQQCGFKQTGWAGKCPECSSWGSMVEQMEEKSFGKSSSQQKQYSLKSENLKKVSKTNIKRLETGIKELDRVLGGGLVSGQVVLLAGEPGIGKSTILLQLASKFKNSLYISGEESINQIKVRSDRLKIDESNIAIAESVDIDEIIYLAKEMGKDDINVLIIDSVQTMTTSDLNSVAGSVSQVREITNRVVHFAKSNNIPTILVGHVTKEGSVAGPATLAHMVDTVLWFEGSSRDGLRILRSVKNRFGPTDEIGVFEMKETGLVEIDELNNLFTSDNKNVAGSVITSTLEGTRPIVVEIQALVVRTNTAFPKRIAQGIDSKRLELLIAIVAKRLSLPLWEYDVFVNAVGGIKITEPAVDLAICLSIMSSYFEKSVKPKTIAIGEVGLLGEIRAASREETRIKQAKRQGYINVISKSTITNIRELKNILV